MTLSAIFHIIKDYSWLEVDFTLRLISNVKQAGKFRVPYFSWLRVGATPRLIMTWCHSWEIE